MAEVVAVCISENKGERKKPVDAVELRLNHGIGIEVILSKRPL